MKTKIITLHSQAHPNVDKLKKIHSENPFHASVFFKSIKNDDSFVVKNTIKTEYFNDDGTKVEGKFRISEKHKTYFLDSEYNIKNRIHTEYNILFNGDDFKIKRRHWRSYSKFQIHDLNYIFQIHDLNHINDTKREIVVRIILEELPWTLFLFEHNLNLNLNKIIEEKLFSLKKVLQVIYPNIPFKIAKELHRMLNIIHYSKINKFKDKNPIEDYINTIKYNDSQDYLTSNEINISNNVQYDYYQKLKNNSYNISNINPQWLLGNTPEHNISNHLINLGSVLDKKVNCSWSLGKMNSLCNKWAFELANILYAYNNKDLNVSNIFKAFEEQSGIYLIKDLKGLNYEAYRMNHCIANYANDIKRGKFGIYSYKNHTFSLKLGKINHLNLYLSNINKNNGLLVTEFRGIYNNMPPDNIVKEVEDKILHFNRYLISLPMDEYEEICKKNEIPADFYDEAYELIPANFYDGAYDGVGEEENEQAEYRYVIDVPPNEADAAYQKIWNLEGFELSKNLINVIDDIVMNNPLGKDTGALLNALSVGIEVSDYHNDNVKTILLGMGIDQYVIDLYNSIENKMYVSTDDLIRALRLLDSKFNPYWDLILRLEDEYNLVGNKG